MQGIRYSYTVRQADFLTVLRPECQAGRFAKSRSGSREEAFPIALLLRIPQKTSRTSQKWRSLNQPCQGLNEKRGRTIQRYSHAKRPAFAGSGTALRFGGDSAASRLSS